MTPTVLPLEIEQMGFRASGQYLLSNITLSINNGPLSVIMGHNGAGKSLLLKLMHGLLHPSSGTISWNGQSPNDVKRDHAMVFQKPVVLQRSVLANIEYPLKLRKIDRDERKARAIQALTKTGLSHIAHRYAPHLSGGEQQKLVIARAWALQPQVLFLDEPTASLDPASTRDVEALIRAVHASGTKIIMTSHLVSQVKRLADEIIFLHDGTIVESGPADDILETPTSAQARAYLAGELPD